MFGLTRREQRWKAEQKAAETIAGVLVASVNAKSHRGEEMNKAEQLIACLEGEIAKRDARIAELEKELQAGATSVENCELFRAMLADPAAPAADAWIPVSERLPDSGSTVIAYYLNSYGKGRTIRAVHVEAWTIEAEDVADADAECVDYSEQDDCYYLLQGWYECIDNWDEYYRVAVTEGPITHWMPLPAAPIKIEANRHDQ